MQEIIALLPCFSCLHVQVLTHSRFGRAGQAF